VLPQWHKLAKEILRAATPLLFLRGFYLRVAFNIFFVKNCGFYWRAASIRESTVDYFCCIILRLAEYSLWCVLAYQRLLKERG